MSSEQETLEYQSNVLVQGIIKDWVGLGAKLAHAGRGDINDCERGFHDGVKNMQWSQLAEPWLITDKILNALKLAGWTAPEGSIEVTYQRDNV